jgi:hypothetical protein
MHGMSLRSGLSRIFLLSLVCLIPPKGWAQNSSNVSHGMWVWKTSTVLAPAGSAEALSKFCSSQHISEVYLSFSNAGGASVFAERDKLLANVIALLHRSNVRVEALLSSTDADEAGKPRDKLLDHIRAVIAFNQSHRGSSFDGVHLDIEPQQRPENKGAGNLNFLPGLVEAFRAARELAVSAHLSINADIQNKLLKGDADQRRSLLSSLPRITLMLYELSSPSDGESVEQKEEKLRSASKRFMEMAYAGLAERDLAKMAIGLRTPDYEQLLPQMLMTVDEALRNDPHYLGWALHSWNDQAGVSGRND